MYMKRLILMCLLVLCSCTPNVNDSGSSISSIVEEDSSINPLVCVTGDEYKWTVDYLHGGCLVIWNTKKEVIYNITPDKYQLQTDGYGGYHAYLYKYGDFYILKY